MQGCTELPEGLPEALGWDCGKSEGPWWWTVVLCLAGWGKGTEGLKVVGSSGVCLLVSGWSSVQMVVLETGGAG